MKDHRQWINAAKKLIENPFLQVVCPKCGLAFLGVEDHPVDESHFERRLQCPNCGARESIFKRTGKADSE